MGREGEREKDGRVDREGVSQMDGSKGGWLDVWIGR